MHYFDVLIGLKGIFNRKMTYDDCRYCAPFLPSRIQMEI